MKGAKPEYMGVTWHYLLPAFFKPKWHKKSQCACKIVYYINILNWFTTYKEDKINNNSPEMLKKCQIP